MQNFKVAQKWNAESAKTKVAQNTALENGARMSADFFTGLENFSEFWLNLLKSNIHVSRDSKIARFYEDLFNLRKIR